MISALPTVDLAELDRDPYPVYAELRREAPVVRIEELGTWLITRHADCLRVCRDYEIFRGSTAHPTNERVFGKPNILTSHGPPHREFRRAIDPAYRPRVVDRYIDDLVRPIVAAQLQHIRPMTRSELMADYFEPISVLALAAMLGIPDLDADTLRRWFHALILGSSNEELDPAKFEVSDLVSREIEARLDPLLEELAAHPDDSTISHMLHDGMPAGEVRGREWIYPTLKVTIAGGMQEPGHGAGITTLGLLENRDQYRRVSADLSLIPAAVTEGLRWIAPIGHTERQPLCDVEIGGVTVPEGEPIDVIIASANRDERRFTDPDAFDVDRTETGHIAFGGGQHFCSGHYFAREAERIALEGLIGSYPQMRLDPERSAVVRGWVFRGPTLLPVILF